MLTNTLQWLFEYRWWKDDIKMKHEWKKQYIGSDILKEMTRYRMRATNT